MCALASYDRLVESGFIGRLKRDFVVEACDDVMYFHDILAEVAGESDGVEKAIPYAIRIVRELVEKGYCSVATWGGKSEPIRVLELTDDELLARFASDQNPPFQFFLLGTSLGMTWVKEYRALVGKL